MRFYSILFILFLFCSVLSYPILYSLLNTLFYSQYSILFYSVLFYYILFYSIFVLQKRAIRTISKPPFDAHTGPIFKELNILSLHNIYLAQIGKIMFQYKAGLLPTCFENIFLLRSQIHVHNTKNANYFSLPKCKTNIRLFSFQYQGPKFFNSLSHELQNSPNIASFKHKLKLFLLS